MQTEIHAGIQFGSWNGICLAMLVLEISHSDLSNCTCSYLKSLYYIIHWGSYRWDRSQRRRSVPLEFDLSAKVIEIDRKEVGRVQPSDLGP